MGKHHLAEFEEIVMLTVALLYGEAYGVSIADEIEKENSVYSLVNEEDHPFWKYLYRYGNKLPFVSTVYGNAIFQYGDKHKKFLIFVSPSGFVVRQI